MGILSKFIFYCRSNGCPFLCAICYFHAKTINMYSTIKHKSMFQKLHKKHRTSNLAFLGHSSLPDGSGCMSASFYDCWWCQVCSLYFSFWLGLGWMWASNIYVHGIHLLRSIPAGFLWLVWVQFKFSFWVAQIMCGIVLKAQIKNDFQFLNITCLCHSHPLSIAQYFLQLL